MKKSKSADWLRYMRFTEWLDSMLEDGYITEEEYDDAMDAKRKELGI